MDYRLNLGAWRKIFAVPECVAENHLKIASGTQIKVLLYMLAHPELGHRAELIAETVGVSREDVDDALLYWVNADILSNDGMEYYPSDKPAENTAASVSTSGEKVQPLRESAPLNTPEARALLNSETHFPPKAIASAINGDNAVKCLFGMYEKLAGRPPKHSEQQTLMVLVEEIGLPCEVTMMLVEYCFNIEKATPAYMKAVAMDWCENGITDITSAEERIKLLQSRYTAEKKLQKKFGMTSAFSSKQKQTIAEWTDLGLSEELIGAAYDITLDNTGKLSFSYMDKILRSWLNDGITDPSQAAKPKKPSAGGSGNADAPSYDLDEASRRTANKYKDL